ncbi:uncharacterized protein LOC121786974 [Salvia splendens]|uniref:uncharacterized protein LOC121786974 n=1 Tax=Salvia splendens TaxID=180675 RepID=UPI001C27E09D|nr:uncharacterized protein LOC121786974 [Salvia splendens]
MKKAIEASPITIGGSETIVEIKRSRSYYEMHKGKFKLKDKLVGVRHVRSTTGNSRGAKIVDCDEADEAEPSGKIHRRSPRSAETNEAWETLKKSSKELRASVKDPLPDAIHNGLRQDKRQEVAENNSITIHNGYFGSSITCSSPFLTLILPRSAETNEAWEALKKSSKELRASVKDPLPDAIHNGLRQDKRQEVAENNSITIHNGYFGSSITCSSPFLTLILPRSAETNEAWEALKKSSKELRASVRIPFLMQSTTV